MTRIWLLLAIVGCGSGSPADRPLTFGGDRPVDLKAPPMLEDGKLYPLLLVLHGFSLNGFAQSAYFNVNTLPAQGELLLLAPDGLTDPEGHQFWNADPACCDFYNTGVDDVGYLSSLIEDVSATWPVDPHQVFVLGHSNGAFMAYRLACDRADLLSGVAALAGNTSLPASSCVPSRAISMLTLHGTDDVLVPYDGSPEVDDVFGHDLVATAGAIESTRRWAGYDGCGALTDGATLDLDGSLVGNETTVQVAAGCPAGVDVELWTITGAGHIPAWSTSFTPTLMSWFTANHP